ncbi:MAG: AraC family ligand binding domain-containing protein [Ruminococcus sp.]
MAKKRKMKMEFRYYQMQDGSPILALLGEKWEQNYGRDVDFLHFHNYLEIGYCYSGAGELVLGEEPMRFAGREFTIIPPNFPHTTTSDIGNISKWEYLFIDVEGFLANAAGTPLRAEKMVQRIYSKAFCLKECEYKSLSDKILKLLDIMRGGEEFYLEEAKGILTGATGRGGKAEPFLCRKRILRKRKDHQHDRPFHRLHFSMLYGGYPNWGLWQRQATSARLISAGCLPLTCT